jgi:hypothetical protein
MLAYSNLVTDFRVHYAEASLLSKRIAMIADYSKVTPNVGTLFAHILKTGHRSFCRKTTRDWSDRWQDDDGLLLTDLAVTFLLIANSQYIVREKNTERRETEIRLSPLHSCLSIHLRPTVLVSVSTTAGPYATPEQLKRAVRHSPMTNIKLVYFENCRLPSAQRSWTMRKARPRLSVS